MFQNECFLFFTVGVMGQRSRETLFHLTTFKQAPRDPPVSGAQHICEGPEAPRISNILFAQWCCSFLTILSPNLGVGCLSPFSTTK